jgi:hypothetical protein
LPQSVPIAAIQQEQLGITSSLPKNPSNQGETKSAEKPISESELPLDLKLWMRLSLAKKPPRNPSSLPISISISTQKTSISPVDL